MTRNRRRRLLATATLALAATACGGGTPGTGTPGAGASVPAESPTTGPSAVPPTDLSGFDAAVAAAAERARQIPRAGQPLPGGPPTCEGLGAEGPPARFCVVELPAADPIVTIWATSSGSIGATAFMMAYAASPDGVEATELPAPVIGDDVRLTRSWGERGCIGVLAVRDGTLVLSVQVRLAAEAAASDCGIDVPTDYLAAVARSLLHDLQGFGAIGLTVDDLEARDRVVRLIVDGTLRPGERDLVLLPPEFANLSDTGEVVASHDGTEWTIVFFEVRGVVDNYSGWVFRSSGQLGPDEDPLGGDATVTRIGEHWFHIVAS